jgi:glycosyltransferase involved in cell wall biosynthesis
MRKNEWPSTSQRANDHNIPPPAKRLIYLIGTYPSLTTTFIDREIRTLRGWGVDIQVVAMRRPPPDLPLSGDQEGERHEVIYLFPVAWPSLLASHIYFLLRRPRCFIRTLAYLLTRSHPGGRSRFKTLLHFSEGVYAAYLVRDQSFRELHAHFADRAATIALIMGRLLRKPYSMSVHAGADIYVNPVLLREKVREARHVVTCTPHNKAHLEAVVGGEMAGKITYVPHGLELTRYCPGPPQPNGRPIILAVGQLAERKGLDHLIRSCSHLRSRGYGVACHIVGQGPQQPLLEDLIAHLGLNDTVTLHGALPHEAVIDQYKRATLFALPCIQTRNGDIDGIPNVLIEAMAMQLAVVSTNLSAIPELVQDRVNGLLVPPEDSTALADAIAQLLDRPDLRKGFGANGRRLVLEKFDVEHNVRQMAVILWPEWFAPANGQHA